MTKLDDFLEQRDRLIKANEDGDLSDEDLQQMLEYLYESVAND